jgi:predicted dehydrogenase
MRRRWRRWPPRPDWLPRSPSSTATTRGARGARARIAQGDLGPLHLIHGSYLQDWLLDPASNNWRVDPALGGTSRVFADIGSHWCDLVEWVSGERFAEVNAAFATVIAERSAVTGRASARRQPARRRRSRARTWQRRCSGPAPARWRR